MNRSVRTAMLFPYHVCAGDANVTADVRVFINGPVCADEYSAGHGCGTNDIHPCIALEPLGEATPMDPEQPGVQQQIP